MAKYVVTGWRVVSQYASAEIKADSAEAARLAALKEDERGCTPLDAAGFEDCEHAEEVDEIRVVNADTDTDEMEWRDPDLQAKIAAADMLAALKGLLAWEQHMGGWDGEAWAVARAAIARAEGR